MDKLSKMVPIRYMFMIWVPLIVMRFLPWTWWGIVLDLVLVGWIVSLFMNSTHSLYDRYQTFIPFVFFNALFLTLALWIDSRVVTYVCAFLIVISFGSQFHHIDNVNKSIKS